MSLIIMSAFCLYEENLGEEFFNFCIQIILGPNSSNIPFSKSLPNIEGVKINWMKIDWDIKGYHISFREL